MRNGLKCSRISQTSNEHGVMSEPLPSRYTRGRVEQHCEDALRRSGAAGVIPTPLDALHTLVGVSERVTISSAGGVLGAVWFEERVMFVESRQRLARRRFTEAHELAHLICPWHEAVLRLDTAAE